MGISFADMPRLLLGAAVRMMPAERREWGAAMLAELAQLNQPFTRWRFALGCARVAMFPPRKGRLLQTLMNDNMKSIVTALGSAAVASSLIAFPFMLLEVIFIIVKLDNFSLRNAIDLIVVFGVLWLALTAIIFILSPIARSLRAGNNPESAQAHARGNALKSILTTPRSAAIIGFLLALPFMIMLSLLMLNIEPPLGPLESLIKNPDPDQPDVLGSIIALGAFLLSILACAIVRAPIVRTMRAGGSLFAHPINLTLAVVILSFITIPMIVLIIDQFPCWIGVPNCD